MKLQNAVKQLVKITDVDIPDRFFTRMKTGIDQLDQLFGNGILPGLTFTLTARPGTGKTTLLLQLLDNLQKQGYRTAYFTGEEDMRQVAYSCRRLGVTEISISNETDIDVICDMLDDLDIIVIDSFPCIDTSTNMNRSEREKYIVNKIMTAAEATQCAIGLVLHITKTGDYKGGTLIPHAVGANFSLNVDDEDESQRIVSSSKNRYGSVCNVAIPFGENGFNFEKCRRITDADRAPSKAQQEQKLKEQVLSMKEPPGISMARVMRELNINRTKAYVLLKDLVTEGKLKKFGRGDNAIWKHATVVR